MVPFLCLLLLLRTGYLPELILKNLVKLRYYQAHNKFIPTASASVVDPDANRLGMSLTGSYPVKVSAIKDLETLFRDIIRFLSQTKKERFHKKRK